MVIYYLRADAALNNLMTSQKKINASGRTRTSITHSILKNQHKLKRVSNNKTDAYQRYRQHVADKQKEACPPSSEIAKVVVEVGLVGISSRVENKTDDKHRHVEEDRCTGAPYKLPTHNKKCAHAMCYTTAFSERALC